jgi:hypothetical protein
MSAKHTPAPWEVGQHPAVPNGWIVKPVLFGNRVRILPECEGGHVVLRSKDDARLIAAAPDMLAGHVEIDQSAPADEPPAKPTSRDADDAFNEGYARAMWDAALISRALVAKATGGTP